MSRLLRVISGGQDGADVAGLRAAKACGIPTGGWMPQGCLTKSGPNLARAKAFGMFQTASPDYPTRTESNVLEGDATIRFALTFGSPGEELTASLCRKHKRPMLDVPLYYKSERVDDGLGCRCPGPDTCAGPPCRSAPRLRVIYFDVAPWDVAGWIEAVGVDVLNVAGNARADIEAPVERFLTTVFRGGADA